MFSYSLCYVECVVTAAGEAAAPRVQASAAAPSDAPRHDATAEFPAPATPRSAARPTLRSVHTYSTYC